MQKTHDPYLNTAKRSLQNKEARRRKQRYEQKLHQHERENFLSQKIILHNYIKLPEGLQNMIGLVLFIFLPYTIGIMFIFFIVAQANIESYEKMNMTSFLLLWTIGYEVMAFLLLFVIVKSALIFKKTL